MINNFDYIFNLALTSDEHLFNKENITPEICIKFLDYVSTNLAQVNLLNGKNIIEVCKQIEDSCEVSNFREKMITIKRAFESILKTSGISFEETKVDCEFFGRKRLLSTDVKTPPIKRNKVEHLLAEDEQQILSKAILALKKPLEGVSDLDLILKQALEENNLNWIECTDKDGFTILHYLVNINDFELASSIVKYAKNVNIQSGVHQLTPLYCAYQSPSLVQLLCKQGADISILNHCSFTVWDRAILMKEYKTVEMLLEIQPDLAGKPDTMNNEPLHLAIDIQDEELIKTLVQRGAGTQHGSYTLEQYIANAIRQKRYKSLEALFTSSLSINYTSYKYTPLITACEDQDLEAVNLLLKLNADVNEVNRCDNETALLAAMPLGSIEIVQTLIHYRADINYVANISGNTVLAQLLSNQQLSFAEFEERLHLLSQNGLDLNIRNYVDLKKLLAAAWGMGNQSYFHFGNKRIKYEGIFSSYFPALTLQKSYPTFISELEKHAPDYLSSTLIEKSLHSNDQLNFYFNRISSASILKNSKISPQTIDTGWEGHATAVVIYQPNQNQELAKKPETFLAFCNRGEGCLEKSGIIIYKTNENVTVQHIEEIRKSCLQSFFEHEIHTKLKLKEIHYISLKEQKVGNCAFVSRRTSVYAKWLLINYVSPSRIHLHLAYKSYSLFTRENILEEYLEYLIKFSQKPQWTLLAHIRIAAEKKLKKTSVDLQKMFLKRVLMRLDKYHTYYFKDIVEIDLYEFIHYLIALNNQNNIKKVLEVEPNFDLSRPYGGITPLKTAQKTGNLELIEWIKSLISSKKK